MFKFNLRRNKLLQFGVISLTALTLAACGGETSGSNSPSTTEDGKVQIEFWTTDEENYAELVAEFEEQHPDIDVVASYHGGYDEMAQKIQAAVVAKNLPDVAQLGQRHAIPQIADSGQLIPIEELIDQDTIDDIHSQLWDRFRYKDQLWTIPFESSTPVLYYNKTLFEEHGVKVPETWDELVQAAEALTIDEDGDGTNEVWGFNMAKDTPWYIQPMAWNRGAKLINEDGTVDLNSPEMVETIESFKDIVHERKAMPINQHNTADDDFKAGKLALFYKSGASFQGIVRDVGDSFEVGTTFLPAVDERNVPIGGNSLGVFKSSDEEQEASLKLVEFLTSTEKVAEISMATGYIPVRQSAMELQEFKDHLEEFPNAKVTIDQMEFLYGQPINPSDSLIWNELVTILEMVEQDQDADVQKILDQLQKKVSQFLEDYQG
ncbi:ABC transporter substrate-binding protein [Bacillus sp. JJ1562]|uniref:ABC transporter substrate-binding protein n=1 Tax=Bacillus sp. JJ1562 TaxID=3122960 RepID=UPI00300154CA